MITTSRYFARFIELLKEHKDKTHYQIYELLEIEVKDRYGRNKFSSYGSFRFQKSQYFADNR